MIGIDRAVIRRMVTPVLNTRHDPSCGVWADAALTGVAGTLASGETVSGLAIPAGYSPISFTSISAQTGGAIRLVYL